MSVASANTTRTLKVAMGGVEYARGPEALETLLGSCVGIALWDPASGWGGLAHIVLPHSNGQTAHCGKYADTAVPAMLDELSGRGALRMGLVAKLAGGATMFGDRKPGDIGQRNFEAAKQRLAAARIRVIAEHIGGTHGRVVRFCLATGRLQVFIGRELAATI